MTSAQREVLERLMTGPIGLRAATARVLHRSGLIEPDGDYWVITAAGRRNVEHHRWDLVHAAVVAKLTDADHEWGKRVCAWLTATEQEPEHFLVLRHLRHKAACEHAGIDPGPLDPHLPEDWAGLISGTVRAASECLRQLDEESRLAAERGVGITAKFAADPAVPRSRGDAAAAAARDDGALDPATYRARRPA